MPRAEGPISRFPVPHLGEVPSDIRERIESVEERTGFVPNVFMAMAGRPAEWRAFVAYHDAVMEREGGLSKVEREMIAVATSALSRCPYCVVAHGAILRVRSKDAITADYLATNYRSANLEPRHREMLDYAAKLARHPEDVDEPDIERLRTAGFSDDEIWDIAAVTAFFAMSNRLAHAMALRPNAEFHTMGRFPPS